MGLQPFVFWDFGFESCRGHGYLSPVNVICCPVQVSVKGWWLVQRCPTVCGLSVHNRAASRVRRLWSTRGCGAIKKVIYKFKFVRLDMHVMQQKKVELWGYKNLSTFNEQRFQWYFCAQNYLHILTIVYNIRLVINKKKIHVWGTCVILTLL